MTIVTVLTIPEGIILASDTQMTLFKSKIPVNAFMNTQKIFDLSINNLKAAIIQFGNAFPANKPLSSHVFSIREILKNKNDDELKTIELVADIIIEYFSKYSEKEVNNLGLYLCGFTKKDNEIIQNVFSIQFRYDSNNIFQKNKNNLRKDFVYALTWAGEGGWIIGKLLKLSDPKQGIKEAEISYGFFSLVDGIEFSNYLIRSVIGFEKFQSRFPTCGGKVQIAVLTPRYFKFINLNEDINLTI